MSMAGLLTKFGHDAGRWVSPAGRVSIAPTTANVAGYRVRPHTFHGGDDPQETAESRTVPWWADDASTLRERSAMAEAFPSFVELPGDQHNPPAWYGVIDTGRGRFPIFLVHRWDRGLPSVVPIEIVRRGKPRGRGWVKAPHLYTSGNLCVADLADWDEETMTMADVVAWAAHWHACYVEWLATDRWPSEGVTDAAA